MKGNYGRILELEIASRCCNLGERGNEAEHDAAMWGQTVSIQRQTDCRLESGSDGQNITKAAIGRSQIWVPEPSKQPVVV